MTSRELDFGALHPYNVTPSLLLLEKKEDSGSFFISCLVGSFNVKKALCDLGFGVNMMPLGVYKLLRMGGLKPTSIKLLMAHSSVKKLMDILCDIEVRDASFMFPPNFMVLDCKVNF